MFPFINIFGKVIGTYSIMSVLGLLTCGFISAMIAKRIKIAFEDVILLMLSIVGGIMIGGHLLYAMTHLDILGAAISRMLDRPFTDTLTLLVTVFGGSVFYGGLFGAIAAIAIYTRFSKAISRPAAYDLLAFSAPLFHTFGRIGCFLGGCCYGAESSWGFIVYNNPFQPDINGVARIPIQLIEAGCNLILFFIIFLMFLKEKQRGKLIFIYLPSYAVIRFCTEFFRGDAIRGAVCGISTSQWISIFILLFCAVFAFANRKRQKRI